MSQEFEAIYENGVLRPLKPVGFREHEVVSVSVTSAAGDAGALAVGARQREILLAFAGKMESLVGECPDDGTTNRDHDQIVYGAPS
jgi:predicted DNA-binding antitoxin AbrB/MazE fold protein